MSLMVQSSLPLACRIFAVPLACTVRLHMRHADLWYNASCLEACSRGMYNKMNRVHSTVHDVLAFYGACWCPAEGKLGEAGITGSPAALAGL